MPSAAAASESDPDAGTPQRILDAATELFLTHGYDGTSVSAIARKVGVSTPALYWHFPSKQDLFFAVLNQTMQQFLSAVHAGISSTEPHGRLCELVRAHVRFQLEQRDRASTFQMNLGFRTLIEQLPEKYRGSIADAQRAYMHELRQILREGKKAGVFIFEDLTVTTFAVITLCDFSTSWYNPEGALSPAEVADLYVQLALRMVGGEPR